MGKVQRHEDATAQLAAGVGTVELRAPALGTSWALVLIAVGLEGTIPANAVATVYVGGGLAPSGELAIGFGVAAAGDPAILVEPKIAPVVRSGEPVRVAITGAGAITRATMRAWYELVEEAPAPAPALALVQPCGCHDDDDQADDDDAICASCSRPMLDAIR